MEYLLHVAILIGIYSITSVSLNLVCGYTGLLSLAHAAFFGVGAYTAALLGLHFDTPLVVGLGSGILGAIMLGVVVGIPSLRLHEDYFVLATFGFQVITFSVMNNWVSFTGGPLGLPGVPQPRLLGISLTEPWQFLVITLVASAAIFGLARQMVASPMGRVLRAIREDEVLTLSLGKDAARFKIIVFLVAGAFASVAGCIYAWYMSFVNPSTFTIHESIFMLTMVIVGGPGSLWGSILGATLLVSLPEAVRFVGIPSSMAANARQMLYGLALIAVLMFRPQGLVGEYRLREQ